MSARCLFLFFAFIVNIAYSHFSIAAPTISVDANTSVVKLHQQVDYINNPEKKPLIDIIHNDKIHQFLPIDLSSPNQLVELEKDFILRLSIYNASKKTLELWLTANPATIKQLNAYQLINSNDVIEIPNVEHLYSLRNLPLKKINLPPNTSQIFFISAHSTSPHSFNFKLMKPDNFIINELIMSNSFSVSLGMLIMLLICNLYLAVYYQSPPFLFHGCLLLSTTCINLISIGFPSLVFNNFNEWQTTTIAVLFFTATTTAMMCTQAFIKHTEESSRSLPWLTKGIIFNAIYCVSTLAFVQKLPFVMLIPFGIAITFEIVVLSESAIKYKNKTASLMAMSIGCVFFIFLILSINKSTTFSIDMLIDPILLYASIGQSAVISLLFFIHHQKLHQVEQSEELNNKTAALQKEAKNEILKIITGQLQTPLSHILGSADILLSQHTHSPEERKHIDTIRNQVQLLVNKIADIDYEIKLKQYSLTVRRSPFELRSRVERWIKNFQMLAREKNIEITIDISHDIPETVMGDEYRLRHIITKLMEISIQRTAQGQINFKLWRNFSNRDMFVFTISDTGILSEQPSPENEQVIDKLLKDLNSTLTINSNIGFETISEFCIELPVIEESHSNEIIETLNKKKLLIVDDNITASNILKQQTSRWGLKVDIVHNGNEAIGKFNYKANINEPYDIIIIDYDMPKMSGLALAETIKNAPHIKPFIILLAGSYQAPSEHISLAAGVDIVIDKPVPQKLLRMTLSNFFLSQQKSAHDALKKLKVLVTDDDETQRFVISTMLDGYGIQYEVAKDGTDACNKIISEDFDVILMDCEMPKMNGFEAAENIHLLQQKRNQKLTPIIALTAYTLSEYKERSMSAGMSDYLEKPIDKSELIATLQRHIP